MGGGRFEGGNVTPVAEFNIYADPHAAQAVLHAGAPVVLHPLDVTHRALTSGARIAAFRALGTRRGRSPSPTCWPSPRPTTWSATAPRAGRCTTRT